jgi:hypothetical protein
MNTNCTAHANDTFENFGATLSDAEMENVKGGIVAIEYLLVGTLVALTTIGYTTSSKTGSTSNVGTTSKSSLSAR